MDRTGAWRDAAGWIALTVALVVGLSGAASTPEGVRFGEPRLLVVVLALAVVGLAALVGGAQRGRLGLGVLPALGAALASPWFPSLRYVTGEPLAALALGVALAVGAGRRPGWEARLFLPVVALVYALGAWRVQVAVGPEGDEPHYLVVADSLLRDHDVEVGRDFERGRYQAFHPRPLEPHYRVRGRDGRIYSLHAVGLSVLILPAYALGGYPAVSFLMAALAAWLALEIRRILERVASPGLAAGMSWLVALSPPLVHYAGLVFTEVPAALAVALALRHGVVADEPAGPRRALLSGLALAVLPWLNVRYAPLAAILLLAAAARAGSVRRAWPWLAPSVVGAAGLMAWHFAIYGFFDPRRVYGRNVEMAPASIPSHLPGVFLDQEFGLFVYAPVLALAIAGFAGRRLVPRLRVTSAALVLTAVLITASWPMWRGGFNPPARFLVPVVAPLATAATAAVVPGYGAGAALLGGWSLWTGLAGTAQRELVHRDRDFGAPLFRVRSGAGEWTRILPGWVLEEDHASARRSTPVWAVLLLLAIVPVLGRRLTPGTLAAAQAAVVMAVVVAGRLAPSPPVAREAIRLVWQGGVAEWGPDRLRWGPLYEPHRHPDGAVVAERLPLPPGGYVLDVEGDRLGSEPSLEIEPEPRGQRRLVGRDFVVREGERAVTLRLKGGGPILIRRISLSPIQP